MENPQITSEVKTRIKDPRRVAAGKRLAAISKEAKERKACERFNAEKELSQQDVESGSGGSSKYIVVGLILAGAVVYYGYNKIPRQPEQRSEKSKQSEQSEQGDKLVNLFY